MVITTMWGDTAEIGEPYLYRIPLPPARIYTGREVKAVLILPSGDGFKEIECQVEDTPEGWHKHRCEQARLFGEKAPAFNPFPPVKTVYRIPVTINGQPDYLEHSDTSLSPQQVFKMARNAVHEKLHMMSPEK